MNQNSIIAKVSPIELRDVIEAQDQCHVIDVREMSEVESERVEGTLHTPLSAFDKHTDVLRKDHHIYVLCRTGNRAQKAAERLVAAGYPNVHVVEGGIEAWKAAGLKVKQGQSKVWSLERQVRFTAGSIVLLGVSLGYFVHPGWLFLPAAIAGGLVFSAATDTCGMGLLLAKMPWNQRCKNK